MDDKISLSDVRRELERRGVPTQTPGLRGEERLTALSDRLQEAKAAEEMARATRGRRAVAAAQQGSDRMDIIEAEMHAGPLPSDDSLRPIEDMSLSDIRDELTAHGAPTGTQGLRGAARQGELARRLHSIRRSIGASGVPLGGTEQGPRGGGIDRLGRGQMQRHNEDQPGAAKTRNSSAAGHQMNRVAVEETIKSSRSSGQKCSVEPKAAAVHEAALTQEQVEQASQLRAGGDSNSATSATNGTGIFWGSHQEPQQPQKQLVRTQVPQEMQSLAQEAEAKVDVAQMRSPTSGVELDIASRGTMDVDAKLWTRSPASSTSSASPHEMRIARSNAPPLSQRELSAHTAAGRAQQLANTQKSHKPRPPQSFPQPPPRSKDMAQHANAAHSDGCVSLRGMKAQAKELQLQLGQVRRQRRQAVEDQMATLGLDTAAARRSAGRRRSLEQRERVEAAELQHPHHGMGAEEALRSTLQDLEARIVAEQSRRAQAAGSGGTEHHKKRRPPSARRAALESARPTTNADRLGRRALRAQLDGKLDEAASLYAAAIDADEFHITNLGNYALYLQQAKDADGAQHFYDRAYEAINAELGAVRSDTLNRGKTFAVHLMNFASFLSKVREEYDRAENMFKHALDLAPEHAGLLGNYAGFMKRVRRDFRRAEELFQKAILVDPHHSNNLGNYAGLVKAAGPERYHEAEALYRSAVEADPRNASVLSNFGNFMFKCRQRPAEAKALYVQALRAKPGHAMAARNYACFLRDCPEQRDSGAEKVVCGRPGRRISVSENEQPSTSAAAANHGMPNGQHHG